MLKLAKEEARNIVYNDTYDYTVISDIICEQNRWTTLHECIFQCVKTKKYYKTYYRKGSTEQQPEQPFEYDDPKIEEVFKCLIKKEEFYAEKEIEKNRDKIIEIMIKEK